MKTIYISGEIGWDVTADSIRKQVDSKSKKKLRVIINSPGGYTSHGFEIYNIFSAYPGEVEMIAGVMAASAASYIFMSVPVENRKAFKNSSFMLHEIWSSIYGARTRDFQIAGERIEGLNRIYATAYSEGIGWTMEEARETMREDFYLTGGEALLENGIVSEIIDISSINIPKKEDSESDFVFYGQMAKNIEKPLDILQIKATVYATKEKVLEDIKEHTADIEKAAACMKTEIEPVIEPVKEKINTGETNTMTLKEFLEKNPQENALNNLALEAAEKRGFEKNDVAADRARILSILTSSGVVISKEAITAIDDGMTDGDFAKSEIQRQQSLRDPATGKKVSFGPLAKKQTPAEQDPSQGNEESAKQKQETADKIKAAVESTDNIGGNF